jgi:integrase/recombinase XerD
MTNLNKYHLWLKEQNITSGTIRNYSWTIHQYGNQPLTTANISQFLKTNSLKYQAWTIRNQSNALKSYCQFQQKFIDWRIISRVIPVVQPKFYTTLTQPELTQLKATRLEQSQAIYHRNNLILDLLFYSGLRISELTNLRHCDWQGNSLKVWGKGNKVRYVFLPSFLSRVFEPSSKQYLFLTKPGNKLTETWVRIMLKRKVVKAGIGKNITPHTFRRSFATLLNSRGARLTTIQKLLGHSNLETTASYIHNSWEELYLDYSRLWKETKAIAHD